MAALALHHRCASALGHELLGPWRNHPVIGRDQVPAHHRAVRRNRRDRRRVRSADSRRTGPQPPFDRGQLRAVGRDDLARLSVLCTRRLWPTAHSKLFDFAATAPGAEWIDEVAALARQRLSPAGRRVIGHGDWRQEHVRFVGTEPAAAFDWDSPCCHDEPALLGIAAHGICADWSIERRRQAPTLAEARALITEFETARGTPFTADERRLCGGAFTYACAYTARRGHTGGADERHIPGTFEHLVWTERANLLEL
jgi:hypothetical protein